MSYRWPKATPLRSILYQADLEFVSDSSPFAGCRESRSNTNWSMSFVEAQDPCCAHIWEGQQSYYAPGAISSGFLKRPPCLFPSSFRTANSNSPLHSTPSSPYQTRIVKHIPVLVICTRHSSSCNGLLLQNVFNSLQRNNCDYYHVRALMFFSGPLLRFWK